jgi:ribonuclease P protein component
MFPKPLRLTKSFDILFRKGAKITAPFFVLRAVPAFDELPRIAIVVSKKTEKTAVGRNRIRRRLIAAAKEAGFPDCLFGRYRIVLIANEKVLTAEFSNLMEEIQKAFERLDNWRFLEKRKT